ncbi:MAG: heavy metal translocating P-type ATPase [Planctomycetaceae bacterium]
MPSTTEASHDTDVCDHCGLPAPRRNGTELTFCCSGCRGAYQLVHHWGLEDYYSLRDRLMDRDAVTSVTSKTTEQWSDLDDLALLGASSPREVGQGMLCSRLAIDGVHCGACVWLIERMATLLPGCQNARVALHDHSIEITFDPAATKLSRIAEQLAGIGYRVFPWVAGSAGERYRAESRQRLVQIAIAGFCAMNAMWIAIGIYAGEFSGIAHSQLQFLRIAGVMLGLIAAFGPGREFFRGAFAAIKTRTPHMDLPIALGVGVGAIAGVFGVLTSGVDVYFDSVAVLVFLLLVGRWIQFRQQHRAADAVSLLMRMTPALAVRVESDGSRCKVPAPSLRADDLFYVVAGEAIPVDGILQEGASMVDRSLMTGESRPLAVQRGGVVEAGSLNLQSPITVKATASLADSRIMKLMKLVEEAGMSRTPIVQLADSIASRFVMAVLVLAALTMTIWWRSDPMQAASHTVALLIVACPCALALATPLAIAVTLGRAAKRKLLIRSGETLERLSKAGCVWFDKTGTLTMGRPQLTSDSLDDQALSLIASLESQSTHPLSRAFMDAAINRRVALCPTERIAQVEQVSGAGIRGIVDGHFVSVGSVSFARRAALEINDETLADVAAIARRGETPVVFAIDGDIRGVVGIGDTLRPQAVEAIEALRDRGWTIGILSGDHQSAVSVIAQRLGIPHDRALGGLSPEQKLAMMEQSRREHGSVVMVGDGVNDAAALAAADVGIAVRGGAEASLQAAPVYLADSDLHGIVQLIDAARRTVKVIKRNFCVSLFYNSIAVSLAVGGVISPLIAAILMPISSLSILSLTLASKTFEERKLAPGNLP